MVLGRLEFGLVVVSMKELQLFITGAYLLLL